MMSDIQRKAEAGDEGAVEKMANFARPNTALFGVAVALVDACELSGALDRFISL